MKQIKTTENKTLKNKEITMVQIYNDDKKDLHILKVSTNAKSVRDVLSHAIKLLKEKIGKNDFTNN